MTSDLMDGLAGLCAAPASQRSDDAVVASVRGRSRRRRQRRAALGAVALVGAVSMGVLAGPDGGRAAGDTLTPSDQVTRDEGVQDLGGERLRADLYDNGVVFMQVAGPDTQPLVSYEQARDLALETFADLRSIQRGTVEGRLGIFGYGLTTEAEPAWLILLKMDPSLLLTDQATMSPEVDCLRAVMSAVDGRALRVVTSLSPACG